MARTLYFQQITDSRFTDPENCLPMLEERVKKIKHLLSIEGVELKIGKPYLIDWTDTSENNIQYRVDFMVKKSTRKVTWNKIYGLINSVKAVPYKFI